MTSKLLAALLLLPSGAWSAPAPDAPKPSDGVVLSVSQSTMLHFGKLGIGALSTGVGPYLDEKEVRRHGLNAGLSLTVERDPSSHRQVSLAVGDTAEIAGYRIRVEHINSGRGGGEGGEGSGKRGSAVLRLWAPPAEPAKLRRKWWPFW